jgi:hypothetical protein
MVVLVQCFGQLSCSNILQRLFLLVYQMIEQSHQKSKTDREMNIYIVYHSCHTFYIDEMPLAASSVFGETTNLQLTPKNKRTMCWLLVRQLIVL